MNSQYEDPSGRTESKNSEHTQSVGTEPSMKDFEEYNVPKSVQNPYGFKRYAELRPKGELGYKDKEVIEFLISQNLTLKYSAELYQINEEVLRYYFRKYDLKFKSRRIRTYNANDDFFLKILIVKLKLIF